MELTLIEKNNYPKAVVWDGQKRSAIRIFEFLHEPSYLEKYLQSHDESSLSPTLVTKNSSIRIGDVVVKKPNKKAVVYTSKEFISKFSVSTKETDWYTFPHDFILEKVILYPCSECYFILVAEDGRNVMLEKSGEFEGFEDYEYEFEKRIGCKLLHMAIEDTDYGMGSKITIVSDNGRWSMENEVYHTFYPKDDKIILSEDVDLQKTEDRCYRSYGDKVVIKRDKPYKNLVIKL